MAALGFASGLPYALTTTTLQQWFVDAGVDIATIGLFSLVGLPYVLKVLWAPLLDRYTFPLLGRRRGWLLVAQSLLVFAILTMSLVDPAGKLSVVAVVTLGVAFLSASQDIVADAYRADVLPPEQRGPGAATFVSGYRVAMLLTGAIVLILVDKKILNWSAVYALAAGMMAFGIIATLLAPEPADPGRPPGTLADAIVLPLLDFLRRPGGSLVLMFVLLFRLPDTTAGVITGPFLREIGFSKSDIGWYRQFVGGAVTIVAALVGGGVVTRIGNVRSLWLFGALQAASNVGFWFLATQRTPQLGALVPVLVIESFCGGLVTAGFFVFLMNQCRAKYSATQYALLSSVMAVAGIVIGSYTGHLVEAIGYPNFFLITVLLGLPGLFLLPAVGRAADAKPQADHADDVARTGGAFPVVPTDDKLPA